MMGDLASIGEAQVHKDAMCWLQSNYNNMQVWVGGIREVTCLLLIRYKVLSVEVRFPDTKFWYQDKHELISRQT